MCRERNREKEHWEGGEKKEKKRHAQKRTEKEEEIQK